jgi:hypothetical protein
MPDGFGFNWQGHSTAAAYTVLRKIAVKPSGSALAASAGTAVRALASASGVHGINEFIFVTKRGNYLLPARAERSFPLLPGRAAALARATTA